jgi:hypothetical protein
VNDFSNPYHPPNSDLGSEPRVSSARPKAVVIVVVLFLATYPIAIARLIIYGHGAPGALFLASVFVGGYLAWIARRLYQGRRWAWWWVVATSLLGLVTQSVEYSTLALDALSAMKIVQWLMATAALILLLTPTLRAWYLRIPQGDGKPAG